ncbi:DSD1 family PLP-dependent enzyme [Roseomonas hellenica]|uniref:DSD1 family PLP-dependent enzyme n=1 Tax=Plastoroseomonas hellenica TaxID=2687306 RepID=A0ABS5ETZ1_9PROT|nr:alanine racemase [Plastoroseomonas hellenica]MBR0663747.1 DSD1 family PLP-dependent enzyme [Plastoroseomonas hellenica]
MSDTPRLLLDHARLLRNAERLRARCSALGVAFRPHLKTAKCAEVARIAHDGAIGAVTVSTLREAEFLAGAGFSDLLLAAAATPARLPRLAALAARGAAVTIVADDAAMLRLLGEAATHPLPLLLEVDCGEHRSGTDPDGAALLAAAAEAARHPLLRLRGVMTHAGHSYASDDPMALADLAEAERAAATHAAARLRAAGHGCPIVSVGSTPTLLFARHLDGVTEARAGVSLFWDLAQLSRGMCRWEDLALAVEAGVIGHQRHCPGAAGALILDAGALALSKDSGANAYLPEARFGILADAATGARLPLAIATLHQEHGTVPLPDAAWFDRLPLGARVRILPNHACLTAAGGHGGYDVHDGDGVARARWARCDGW